MSILSKRLPTVKQLQCFVAVAENLNFRRAAERLHMSQPPLSRQVHTLEDLLRVRLFERDTHVVSLTAAGEVFLDTARSTLRELEAGVSSLIEASPMAKKTIRVGLTSVLDFTQHAALAACLAEAGRRGHLQTERGYSKRLILRVDQHQTDLALVGELPGIPAELEHREIAQDPLVAAIPADHPAAAKPALEFDDIADLPLYWCARADNPAFYDRCETAFRQFGFEPARQPEPGQHLEMLAGIAAGRGVSLLPSSLLASSRTGVAYRPFVEDVAKRLSISVQLVWRREESHPAVCELRDALLASRMSSRG